MAGLVKGDYLSEIQANALQRYPESKKISRKSFDSCSYEISRYMDLQLLSSYLMTYGIIQSYEEVEFLSSPYYRPPHERRTSLMKTVEMIGRDGYSLLYICLKESSHECRGHQDIVAKLQEHADPDSQDSQMRPVSPVQPSPVQPLDPQKMRFNQIQSFEERFCGLSIMLYDELCDKCERGEFKVRDVTKLIISLPLGLVRELSRVIKLSEILSNENIHELFQYFNKCLWNFIDYILLDYIVQKVGSSSLKQNMAKYVEDITEFSKRVTVSELIEYWPGRKETPCLYTATTVILDIHPNECTLEHLNHLRTQLREQFLPPLSELAVILWKVTGGCIVLTWMIPADLAVNLVRKMVFSRECSKFFRSHKIISFRVGLVEISQTGVTDETTGTPSVRFQELCNRLSNIIRKCSILLFYEGVASADIADFIQSELPDKSSDIYKYLLSEDPLLQRCDTVPHLFHKLQRYSGGLELSLWKAIFDRFAPSNLKQELIALESELERFCLTTSVSDIEICEVPDNFQEMKVHLKLVPTYTTFHILEELRKKLASQLDIDETAAIFTSVEVGREDVWLNLAVPQYSISDVRVAIKQPEKEVFYSMEHINAISLNGEQIYLTSKPISPSSVSIVSLHTPPLSTDPLIIKSPSNDSQLNVDMNLSAEFSSRVFHMNSNGQYPSIAMNNEGWIVQVYHKETVVNLRLRYRIGYLSGEEIIWSSNHITFNKGYYPRVAMNDEGLLVVVFAAQVGRRMWYRVGKLVFGALYNCNTMPSQQVVNSVSIQWKGDKELLGEGRNPTIALNNNKTIAAAYDDGYLYIKTKYRIGDLRDSRIDWRGKARTLVSSQSSKHASIALNDSNQLVVGFSNGFDRTIHCLSGRISVERDDEFTLNESRHTPPGANYQPVVSINNKGHVVAVYHSLAGNLRLKFTYGTLRDDNHTQLPAAEWADRCEEFAMNGYHASITLTDSGRFVTSHKSLLTIPIQRSIHNHVGQL